MTEESQSISTDPFPCFQRVLTFLAKLWPAPLDHKIFLVRSEGLLPFNTLPHEK